MTARRSICQPPQLLQTSAPHQIKANIKKVLKPRTEPEFQNKSSALDWNFVWRSWDEAVLRRVPTGDSLTAKWINDVFFVNHFVTVSPSKDKNASFTGTACRFYRLLGKTALQPTMIQNIHKTSRKPPKPRRFLSPKLDASANCHLSSCYSHLIPPQPEGGRRLNTNSLLVWENNKLKEVLNAQLYRRVKVIHGSRL